MNLIFLVDSGVSCRKRYIIIAGVPRAGKSTVSHRLAKQYGYQHISMDSIIAGFEKCFPETGVNTYAGLSSMDTLQLISGKIAPFVRAMLDSGEYDEFEPGMVLDIYQLLPEDYMRYTADRQDLQWCSRGSTWLAVCSRVALQI